MRSVLAIGTRQVVPSLEAVLEGQGIPRGTAPGERTSLLAQEAVRRYAELARPAGVVMEIGKEEFAAVFDPAGLNDPDAPAGPIHRAADHLALFAVTLGEAVSGEIARLFRENDFAAGALLDAAASAGADMAADAAERSWRCELRRAGSLRAGAATLRFSPGYCGWHLAAQRAIFAALRPADVGIALNESCLMRPLKSVSGVVIAGRREIFDFEDVYAFCARCATHECRERIDALTSQ